MICYNRLNSIFDDFKKICLDLKKWRKSIFGGRERRFSDFHNFCQKLQFLSFRIGLFSVGYKKRGIEIVRISRKVSEPEFGAFGGGDSPLFGFLT